MEWVEDVGLRFYCGQNHTFAIFRCSFCGDIVERQKTRGLSQKGCGCQRGRHRNQPRGANHPKWRNGKKKMGHGYIGLYRPDHPRANSSGYVMEHILVVENATGKPLPPKAEVHHLDHDKANNRSSNLVVCQDRAYHLLLHRKEKGE